MSVVVKANSTRAQAFKRGLLKGLGAPVMLFGTFEIECGKPADLAFKPLPQRKRGSVADDWKAVGRGIAEAARVG